ncbi:MULTISPECIES: hypothetical protein [Streptomyces]
MNTEPLAAGSAGTFDHVVVGAGSAGCVLAARASDLIREAL